MHRLTYCTNIHPGESLAEVCAQLRGPVVEVARKVAQTGTFGVGLRLSSRAASELAQPGALAEFRGLLESLRLHVFTINGFPYGGFHGQRVKERVYAPDFRDDARIAYSNRLAEILAALLPDDHSLGSVSTVPVGYRAHFSVPATRLAGGLGVIAHAAQLVELERRTGKRIVLALEPEPFCALETTRDAVRFFSDVLLADDCLNELARRIGTDRAQAERALRRHVGVCLDACHAAVVFEEPAQSVRQLRAAGIEIAKLQVSAGLEVHVHGDTLQELARFADDVYLHQVFERRPDGVARYLDLPIALSAARLHPELERVWRIHFHVPVFARELGPFASTQASLQDLLALQRTDPFTQHLEVETYTWDVLPPAHRTEQVTDAIVRELSFTAAELEHA